MSNERFLVTGALGCLGAWTVRALREQDFEVIAVNRTLGLDRLRLVLEREELDDITLEQCDISDAEALDRIFEVHAPTRVIHLAALQIPFCREDPGRGAQVNVQGTVNVFESARKRADEVRMVVYSGSVAMYSSTDNDHVRSDENAEPHPETHYGVYKRANEGTAKIYWRDYGIPSIGLRPMVVFGPGRDQGLTSATTLAMRAAASGDSYRIPYGGSSFYNYAPDVAGLIVETAMASVDTAAVYNVPGSERRMDEVVSCIRSVVDDVHVDFEGEGLPFPADVAAGAVSTIADTTITPFDIAVRDTIEHFHRVLRFA